MVVVAIVALSMGLAIAAATVSIGMAQADALPLVGSESWFTIVTCVGVAVAAMSGLTAVAVRGGHIRSGAETPRGRRR